MDLAADAARTGRDAGARPPWQLTDLISVETLQSIQDTFARAFGLPTVIIDTAGTNATAITHRVTFCEDLTRTSPVAGARCRECDSCGMRQAAADGRPAIFKCWNGLYDAAIPIAPKGHVLGYFLCGQVFEEAPDPERYLLTAAEIGVDAGEYVDAVQDVAVVPYEQYQGAVQSMHVLAGMIAEQAAASIDSLQMLEQARRAKEETAQLVQELDTILEALRDIGSQPDYQATLASIADNLARLIPWDSCVIYVTDDEREELVPVVVRDPAAEQIGAYRPRKGRGILGTAALGGPGRRYLDVTQEPEFEPIPGVPLEPESALVMPMVYKGTVSGVIILSRFERRTFTDHELRVLDVFSSQASVSVQVAKLASENAQRLREERAFGRLRLALAPETKVDTVLAEAARAGADLLEVDVGVLSPAAGAPAALGARVGIAEADADALLRRVRPAAERACSLGEPELMPSGSGSLLVIPLGAADHRAFAVFERREGSDWDWRLVRELQAQASLGIENARMQERERRLLLQYQLLSELGTQLVAAHDAHDVREQLLARTPEILNADACFVALLEHGPDAISVDLRKRSHREERTIALEAGARLATLRLRDEPSPDRSVFDTWSAEVFRAVGPDLDLSAWLAEPLPASGGAAGGVFVAWRSPDTVPTEDQSRILRVIASSAGSALGSFAASMATDSILRDRLVELEALASLARRIAGLTDESAIADELLAALRRVGRLDGAVYGTAGAGALLAERTAGLSGPAAAELTEFLERLQGPPESGRLERDDGSELVFVPMPGAAGRELFLAGLGPSGADDQRDRVMATLARYGSVAIENAHLHARQREAIARLERQQLETEGQNTKLERILSVHETLALAVLDGKGLGSVVRSLGHFLDAEILVLAPQERELARWPAGSAIDWRPPAAADEHPRTVAVSLGGAGEILAAPAQLDGEALAWVIARRAEPPGDVERAAVEYGALLVALELLRERTAVEIETRLRGGLLEELFAESVVPEVTAARGAALGYDLARRSRVFVVEAPSARDTPGAAPLEPESFFAPVADCARAWSPDSLVAPRGASVVVIAPELESEPPRRLEDELRRVAGAALPSARLNIGVGTVCEQVGDYRASYLAARRGLDLLRLLDRPGETFSFRVSTLDSMLLQSNRPEVIVEFISRFVEPLDEYDRTHRSELRRTLEVYFESGSTLQEAARRLHVHVSTLRYRLDRAADLLGLDLRDGSAALDLQVALRAARVLGS